MTIYEESLQLHYEKNAAVPGNSEGSGTGL